ncbi:trigger factor isoform X4 [Benincasa hispida]|nr:trigger factor isoform X4 [Benincasa hispida]
MGYGSRKFSLSKNNRYLPAACAVLSEDVSVSSSQFEDFSVTNATNTTENKELKIRVEVSGAKTRAIFNNVFDKMVAEAQPIPGFRRVKGGKTPNIPRDILLEILGPSKVYKQVIEEVINSTVAAYVEKQEALKVGKDLRIEQSYEDLEDQFEPDEKFFFDAIIQLKESN